MNQVTDVTSPQLAPPGAGLPRVELWVARLIFRWARFRTSRKEAEEVFSSQRDEILDRVRGADRALLSTRVLIPRLRGLEDSSRYWSVFMTLDHLRIVNDGMNGAIRMLGAGKIPPRVASTAAVKPDPEVGPEVVEAFETSCRRLEETVSEIPNLATEARYTHPWFGPLDAAGWHVMSGFHLRLHQAQIKLILQRLVAQAAEG